jgi:hypothetical protein
MKQLTTLTKSHDAFIAELSENWDIEIDVVEPYLVYEVNSMYLHIQQLIDAVPHGYDLLSDWYWTTLTEQGHSINFKTWIKLKK